MKKYLINWIRNVKMNLKEILIRFNLSFSICFSFPLIYKFSNINFLIYKRVLNGVCVQTGEYTPCL